MLVGVESFGESFELGRAMNEPIYPAARNLSMLGNEDGRRGDLTTLPTASCRYATAPASSLDPAGASKRNVRSASGSL